MPLTEEQKELIRNNKAVIVVNKKNETINDAVIRVQKKHPGKIMLHDPEGSFIILKESSNWVEIVKICFVILIIGVLTIVGVELINSIITGISVAALMMVYKWIKNLIHKNKYY